MNYLLHNLGYDKPINFREIVLRQYHRNCFWLRDIYFDRLDLHNYEKWLPNIQYEYDMLQKDQEWLEKRRGEIFSLTDEKIQDMYSKKVDNIKVLHNCQHSYHIDEEAKIKRCTDEYNKSLQKWLSIPNTIEWLTADLVDIYDSAMKDLREHEYEDNKSVERMHNTPIPTFEDFKAETIDHFKSDIEFYEDRIESRKRAIERMEKQIEEIKQLFAWLDAIEKE